MGLCQPQTATSCPCDSQVSWVCPCNTQIPVCVCQGNTECKNHTVPVLGLACTCNIQKDALFTCTCHTQGVSSGVACSCHAFSGAVNPRGTIQFLSQTVSNKITPSLITNIQNALSTEAQIRSVGYSWTSVGTGDIAIEEIFSQIKNVINSCEAKDKATNYCSCNIYSNVSGHYSNENYPQGQFKTNTLNIDDSISWNYENGQHIAVSDKIFAEMVNSFQTFTNILQSKCICDCNYCTCNCNYCTCDCNYCPCNTHWCSCNTEGCSCNCNNCGCQAQNYCPCQCNYCTCDCAYDCTCNCNYCCTCQCAYNWTDQCNPQICK